MLSRIGLAGRQGRLHLGRLLLPVVQRRNHENVQPFLSTIRDSSHFLLSSFSSVGSSGNPPEGHGQNSKQPSIATPPHPTHTKSDSSTDSQSSGGGSTTSTPNASSAPNTRKKRGKYTRKTSRKKSVPITVPNIVRILHVNRPDSLHVYDVRTDGGHMEYLVVLTASSFKHMKRMAEPLVQLVQNQKQKQSSHGILNLEGHGDDAFIIIDFGGMVVRFFLEDNDELEEIKEQWKSNKVDLDCPGLHNVQIGTCHIIVKGGEL